jgi:hypothetical protein
VVLHAAAEATGRRAKRSKGKVPDRGALVLGSGNLGLIYLIEAPERMTLEEIEARHPRLLPALAGHPHVGWLLVRSRELGPVIIGGSGRRVPQRGRIEGDDPLAAFSPGAEAHILRTDGFEHAPDILVGSFFDPELDEGCAFEELISFHGGMGGLQTRPFILFPKELPLSGEPVVGAAHVHELLKGWRHLLENGRPAAPTPEPAAAADVPVA